MSTQVTVTLTDEIYRMADRLARLSGRNLNDILADTIALSLSPLQLESIQSLPGDMRPVSTLADDEIRALADLQLDPDQDRQLSLLLDRQQSGLLTETERAELLTLLQVYQEYLLRKAQALHEAVQRGLREPLEP
jgi:hypothetical protein